MSLQRGLPARTCRTSEAGPDCPEVGGSLASVESERHALPTLSHSALARFRRRPRARRRTRRSSPATSLPPSSGRAGGPSWTLSDPGRSRCSRGRRPPSGTSAFGQTNSFYYLSGVETPHAYLVLNATTGRSSLYLPAAGRPPRIVRGTPPDFRRRGPRPREDRRRRGAPELGAERPPRPPRLESESAGGPHPPSPPPNSRR